MRFIIINKKNLKLSLILFWFNIKTNSSKKVEIILVLVFKKFIEFITIFLILKLNFIFNKYLLYYFILYLAKKTIPLLFKITSNKLNVK